MQSNELRSRAEEAILLTRSEVSALAFQDIQHLVRELQVHEIELEMQNESLQHTQAELHRSQHEYWNLYERAPAGYLTLDVSGLIVRANAAAIRMCGVARARLMGKPLSLFVRATDALRLRQHLSHAQKQAQSSCEVQLVSRGCAGIDVQLDTRSAPSRPGYCFAVMTDISARKRAKFALAHANQALELQVAARSIQLETRNRELEAEIVSGARSEQQRRELETRVRDAERLESIGRVAGGIAHEFNNLLVSVLGLAELLLRTPQLMASSPTDHARQVLDKQRKLLELIHRAARTAADLTRQLLVYAGQGHVTLLPVDLARVVAESLELLRTRLSPGIQLRAEITTDLPPVEGDRGQIHQLVTNLVMNAIEALNGSGMIVIRTRMEQLDASALARFPRSKEALPGQFAIVQVLDTGRGIEPSAVSRIFDPFFTTKFTGRGMGLASVLGIVQGHRGAMRISSELGVGTMFEVALPVSALEVERAPATQEEEWRGSGHVLLIDDDDGVRSVVAQMLERLGFEVTVAASGEDGLDRFRHAEPAFAFVVLDWMMPVMSGEAVLNALRELEPRLPVILISGYSTESLATHDEYATRVQKPMTLLELQGAIRSVSGPPLRH